MKSVFKPGSYHNCLTKGLTKRLGHESVMIKTEVFLLMVQNYLMFLGKCFEIQKRLDL